MGSLFRGLPHIRLRVFAWVFLRIVAGYGSFVIS